MDTTTAAGLRRRRLLVRPLVATGALTALAAAFVAGTLVGSAGDSGPGATADPDGGTAGHGRAAGAPAGSVASPVAFRAELQPEGSCDDLLAAYVDRGLAVVGPYGWEPPYQVYLDGPIPLASDVVRGTRSPGFGAARPQVVPQGSSATGTNVQETGVDEPDTVKTGGGLLVRLRGTELQVFDVSGGAVRRRAELVLPGLEEGELLLSGGTVVALGADARSPRDETTGGRTGTRIYTVSLADPDAPEVAEQVTYDSSLLSARQHGGVVRLVLSAGLPDLDFIRPGRKVSRAEALRTNRRLVARSTLEDWLPTYDAGTGTTDLLACDDVAVPPEELGLDTVSVVGFDVSSPGSPEAIGLAGEVDLAYESEDDLYLAATPQSRWGWCVGCDYDGGPGRDTGTTHLFDFALDGVSATHVASGEVEGTLRDRWSVDAVDGVLRLALGPSSETGDFTSVVTLRRDGRHLVELGRLGGLGRHETLRSVRWFDHLAILVTFREVDPLHAVDLSDPSHPRLAGELRIPGFSSYLHPLDDHTLLGLGEGRVEGRRWGAQAGLFDTTDLAAVRRVAVHAFGPGSTPVAGVDPRAFTWLPDRRTALAVLQRGVSGHLAVVRVGARSLEIHTLRVELGADVDQVRTVPLPGADGASRVVLVTGEDVRFLDLDG